MEKMMPREKLARFGAAHLHDDELLRIIIGSGNQQATAGQIAQHLLKLLKEHGSAISYQEVLKIPGMGPAKTCEIIALFELGRRYLMPADQPIIRNADDAFKQFSFLCNKKQECLAMLTLDGANRLIDSQIIFQGTLNQSLIHPREIFAKAIEDRAASIVVAHNHPSGVLQPSEEDEVATRKLVAAGELLGIDVVDHLIVGKSGYTSLRDE